MGPRTAALHAGGRVARARICWRIRWAWGKGGLANGVSRNLDLQKRGFWEEVWESSGRVGMRWMGSARKGGDSGVMVGWWCLPCLLPAIDKAPARYLSEVGCLY